eukprot:8069121-Pyramimonas_sp.AAC.1
MSGPAWGCHSRWPSHCSRPPLSRSRGLRMPVDPLQLPHSSRPPRARSGSRHIPGSRPLRRSRP